MFVWWLDLDKNSNLISLVHPFLFRLCSLQSLGILDRGSMLLKRPSCYGRLNHSKFTKLMHQPSRGTNIHTPNAREDTELPKTIDSVNWVTKFETQTSIQFRSHFFRRSAASLVLAWILGKIRNPKLTRLCSLSTLRKLAYYLHQPRLGRLKISKHKLGLKFGLKKGSWNPPP